MVEDIIRSSSGGHARSFPLTIPPNTNAPTHMLERNLSRNKQQQHHMPFQGAHDIAVDIGDQVEKV